MCSLPRSPSPSHFWPAFRPPAARLPCSRWWRYGPSSSQEQVTATNRPAQAHSPMARDAEGSDISGVPDALREFGTLAMWALPIHGVFVPNNDEVIKVVSRVAREQLGLSAARQELASALKVVKEFRERDPIESALNHAMTVSDEAYFYTGVGFGVTLADYS